MDESREALKAAHRKVRNIDKQIEVLESAAQRAEEAAQQATSELSKHSRLDKEITAWRVTQLKKGGNTKVLPDDLRERVDAKRAAEGELKQSQSAQQAITEELEELRNKRDRAEQDRMTLAIGTLHAMGEILANELYTINIRRAQLLQVLAGLFSMKIDDRVAREVAISTITAGAMKMGDSFAFEPNTIPGPLDEMGRRWQRRLDALCTDPDADITAPKHLEPSDYLPGKPEGWQGPGHALPGAPAGSWKPEAD